MSETLREAKAVLDETEVLLAGGLRIHANGAAVLIAIARRFIEKNIEGCHCKGTGFSWQQCGVEVSKKPCPACARDRELLRDLVKGGNGDANEG